MWNYFDLMNCGIYFIYFSFRFFDIDETIPGPKVLKKNSIYMLIFWVCLNSLLTIGTVIKLLFYARVFQNFNLLVSLVTNVLVDVKNFVYFYISWLILFSLLCKIIGYEIDNGDFAGLNKYAVIFIRMFRNSIGDIQPPIYNFWMSEAKEH